MNRKKIQRLWREEGLRVPAKRRKRQRLGESSTPADRLAAKRPDHVWALDYQFDVTATGRIIKVLHVVDEYTRESLADVVDQDTLASGHRRAGVFYALWAMVAKVALALAVGISFWILDASGFDAYSDDNAPRALLTLAILFGIVPVGFKLVAAAVAWRYPITAERQQALQKAIAAGNFGGTAPVLKFDKPV